MRWLVAATALLLAGCDVNFNYATFVTASHVGIKADTKTEQVSIGIGRSELFVGPGYPDKGTAPSAFGSLQTDAAVFSPTVTQLYATGAAADTVTQGTSAQPSGQADSQVLSGERRPLVFGTNTDVGLKLGFVANAPTSINLGYNREEFSIIPLRQSLGANDKDAYAPVLASISLNVAATTPSGSSLTLGQFFATGQAALNLAADSRIQEMFRGTAQAQVSQAAVQAAVTALNTKVAAVQKYLDGGGGFAANCATLKANPKFHPELWLPQSDPCALGESAFISTLNRRLDIASAAFDSLPANP